MILLLVSITIFLTFYHKKYLIFIIMNDKY